MMGSPEIKRLDIPRYDWWNEALHGVARNGTFSRLYPFPRFNPNQRPSHFRSTIFSRCFARTRIVSPFVIGKFSTAIGSRGVSRWRPQF
jgi:hypothetical protein